MESACEKAGCRVGQYRPSAGDIPAALYSRISLHDHHELAARFGVGGVHLNSRNPSVPDGFGGMVSRSCHSIAELSQYSSVCDYMFLSPIFDSISKSGYVSRFSLEEIRRRIVAGSDVATARMDVMSSDGNCRSVDWAARGDRLRRCCCPGLSMGAFQAGP